MRRTGSALLILLLAWASIPASLAATNAELIESVEPRVAHLKLKSDSLQALVEKQVIVRGLSTKSSREMAGLGVVLADASPEGFIESYRSLATFQQNPCVIESGRLGTTPAVADLERLTIDDKDLYSLSRASVRSSDVKLSEQEIARLHEIVKTSPRLTPQIKAKLAGEYKKILVERARAYLSNGASSLGTYADKDEPVVANDAFVSLSREQAETAGHCGHLYPYLENYPQGDGSGFESFIYWAKQKFGDLKPVINMVHVTIHRDGDRVFIASKQIYSSHYTDAGLSVAELIPFTDGRGVARTIVAYTIRLQVDMLAGAMGFMKKRMAQPRMLGSLKDSLNGLRTTMEALSRAPGQMKAAL
ncbi:MAG: hypothetical protein ACLGJB_15360 [Blastocatellia bacterium]